MARQTRVTLASNGKYWQARYYDNLGRRRTKSLGSKKDISKAKAKKMCDRLAANIIVNPTVADAGRAPTLSDWFDIFIKQKAGISDKAKKTYRLAYKKLCDYVGEMIRIDRITATHAANWYGDLTNSGLAPASISTYVGHVKTMMKAAVDQGLLVKSPVATLIAGSKRFVREWHYIDTETFEKVLEACPNSGWRCFLTLQRYGGLRRGEAMRVQWGMIDLTNRLIRLPAESSTGEKITKTRQPRIIPMAPVLYRELKHAKTNEAAPSDRIVDGVGSTSISNQHSRLRTILKRAGVEPWEDLMQTLRRCAAQDLRAQLKDGWAVTQIMGHSEDVERDHYLGRLRDEDIKLITEERGDPDLDRVVRKWKELSDVTRRSIMKLIE